MLRFNLFPLKMKILRVMTFPFPVSVRLLRQVPHHVTPPCFYSSLQWTDRNYKL